MSYSGEGSRGFAQTTGVRSASGNDAGKAYAKRTCFGGKAGRNRGQRGCAATGISAAPLHAGIGFGRRHARRVLDGSLALCGKLGLSGPICGCGLLGGGRICGASRSAVPSKIVPLKMVPIRRVPDVGLGGNRRELQHDRKDGRPKYPR